MRVNLLAEKRQKISFGWLRVAAVIIMVALIMGLGINYYTLTVHKRILNTRLQEANRTLEIYLPKEREYKRIKKEIETLLNRPDIPQYAWEGPIEALGYIVPSRVMLHTLNVSNDNIIMTGKSRRAEDLRKFKNHLLSSSHFNSVDLKQIEKRNEVTFRFTATLTEREE